MIESRHCCIPQVERERRRDRPFPELPADLRLFYCDAYEHVGQHGGADYPRRCPTFDPLFAERCSRSRRRTADHRLCSATDSASQSSPSRQHVANWQRTFAGRCEPTTTNRRRIMTGTTIKPKFRSAEFFRPQEPGKPSRRTIRRPWSSSDVTVSGDWGDLAMRTAKPTTRLSSMEVGCCPPIG